MKFFTFLLLIYSSLAFGDPTDSCTLTIKCSLGASTCSAGHGNHSGDSIVSSCGELAGQYRICSELNYFNSVQVEFKRYICCGVNGSAISTSDLNYANSLCDNPGTLQ